MTGQLNLCSWTCSRRQSTPQCRTPVCDVAVHVQKVHVINFQYQASVLNELQWTLQTVTGRSVFPLNYSLMPLGPVGFEPTSLRLHDHFLSSLLFHSWNVVHLMVTVSSIVAVIKHAVFTKTIINELHVMQCNMWNYIMTAYILVEKQQQHNGARHSCTDSDSRLTSTPAATCTGFHFFLYSCCYCCTLIIL